MLESRCRFASIVGTDFQIIRSFALFERDISIRGDTGVEAGISILGFPVRSVYISAQSDAGGLAKEPPKAVIRHRISSVGSCQSEERAVIRAYRASISID